MLPSFLKNSARMRDFNHAVFNTLRVYHPIALTNILILHPPAEEQVPTLAHSHNTLAQHTYTQNQLGHRIHLACGREGTCHPAILHQLRRTTVSHGQHSRGQWCGPISSRLHPTATHRHDPTKRRAPERPAASPARRSRTTPTTPARCTSTASPERRSLGTSSASAQRQLKR